jgi:DNA polymerase III subunit epsilon
MTQLDEIAVVDVETTGLFPGGHDRILEVAVVRMKMDGTVLDEYVTLVNPERDVGRTDIHGILAGDVAHAPAFASVVGDVCSRLRGAVVAGHNVTFDCRFLESELGRMGHVLPALRLLCTMEALGGRLVDCCRDYGIELEQTHSALHDAHAAGRLLAYWLAERESDQDLLSLARTSFGAASDWPQVAPSGVAVSREAAGRLRSAHTAYLARLVPRLPVAAGVGAPVAFARYYALLDQVLEDRRVAEAEQVEVERLAAEWGLTSGEARDAHVAYITRLVAQAVADGIVTPAERRDLEEVATALGIESTLLEALLRDGVAAGGVAPGTKPNCSLSGKTVCFTGELRSSIDGELVTRTDAEHLAAQAGLIVLRGVTKKLDILVLADPDTQSGKAKKARGYGTRLMAEAVFWNELGVRVA